MRNHPPLTFLAGIVLFVGFAGCDTLREKEPDAEPKEPGLAPLVVAKRLECIGHEGSVGSVAVSPDGKLVASGSDDGTLRFWNAADGTLIRTVRPAPPPDSPSWIGAVSFSPNGKTVATGISGRRLEFYDAATGNPSLGMPDLREETLSTAFSPDGKALAIGSRYEVRVWGLPKKDKLFEFAHVLPNGAPSDCAQRVRFSPDGRHLAAALRGIGGPGDSDGPMLQVWDLAKGQTVFTACDGPLMAWAVGFSPNGQFLAVDAGEGNVEVHDWGRKRLITRFQADPRVVFCLAYSIDGKALYTGGNDPEVKRWDATTGKPAGSLKGHTDTVLDLALSKDGKILATAGGGGRVFIWHLGIQ